MARKTGIPETLYEEVILKSAQGESGQKIANWLKATHNIQISTSSITRLLKSKKQERQQIAQAAYAEAVAKSANQDLKILDDVTNRLYVKVMKALDNDDDTKAKHLADTLHKYLATRMELSGINQPDSIQPEEDVLQGLLDRIGEYDDSAKN